MMTDSSIKCLAVTEGRRQRQMAYNQERNISPGSVIRAVEESPVVYESARKAAAEFFLTRPASLAGFETALSHCLTSSGAWLFQHA
jgi:excinuclease UvrABC helicase subunit UvrB